MLNCKGAEALQISVIVNGSRSPIDHTVFTALLENSVASNRAAYRRALVQLEIPFIDLVDLARIGDIPYSLFFAPLRLVESQIQAKTDKLLQGLSKQTFSLNSRHTVRLRDIELIVKDLLRKQELAKKYDNTLSKNPIIGLLKRAGRSVEVDARKLMEALGLTHQAVRETTTKEAALNLLVRRLEINQVLVSQSQNNYMPQLLKGVKFSGMTIKDTKVPYIFLAGGDQGDFQEPAGRRVFTLTLMSVLVARGIFAPVTYDGHSTEPDVRREYDIVGEILMPAAELGNKKLASLPDIQEAAGLFKVTPSALVIRLLRLGILGRDSAGAYLSDLETEYSNRKKFHPHQPKPVNAIRKYNGREFSLRMMDALDSGKMSPRDFRRVVCLNKIKQSEINDFREALR